MTINEEDKHLFRSSIDTLPLMDKDGDNPCADYTKQPAFTAYSHITDAHFSGAESVSYAKNGVATNTLKKMKQGRIEAASSLDLHGQTVIEACQAMSQFIYHHQCEAFLHIVHGKGYNSKNNLSLLKTQVVSFLKQHPQVLAFHSCPAKDGGTGAVFVLLKLT